MCGRPPKVINEQADRYGLPLRGKTLDLYAVLSAFHGFLAANKHKLAATDGEDPMSGENSPALEKWREEKWLLARLERRRQEERLLPRQDVHDGLIRMSSILRNLGDTAQREYGPDAAQLVLEALDDWQRELMEIYGDRDATGDAADPD